MINITNDDKDKHNNKNKRTTQAVMIVIIIIIIPITTQQSYDKSIIFFKPRWNKINACQVINMYNRSQSLHQHKGFTGLGLRPFTRINPVK